MLTLFYFRSQRRLIALVIALDSQTSTIEPKVGTLHYPTRDFSVTINALVRMLLTFSVFSEFWVLNQNTLLLNTAKRYFFLNPLTARSLLRFSFVNVRHFLVHSHEYKFLASPIDTNIWAAPHICETAYKCYDIYSLFDLRDNRSV
jgi:hypothetical protein